MFRYGSDSSWRLLVSLNYLGRGEGRRFPRRRRRKRRWISIGGGRRRQQMLRENRSPPSSLSISKSHFVSFRASLCVYSVFIRQVQVLLLKKYNSILVHVVLLTLKWQILNSPTKSNRAARLAAKVKRNRQQFRRRRRRIRSEGLGGERGRERGKVSEPIRFLPSHGPPPTVHWRRSSNDATGKGKKIPPG